MFFNMDNLELYYGVFAIIIIILNLLNVGLPKNVWTIYGLVGVILLMLKNAHFKK